MISNILSNTKRRLIDNSLFFNRQTCVLCGAGSGHATLCAPCQKELPSAPQPCCPVCAAPSDGHLCGVCLKHAPAFDRSHAALRYAFPVDELIQALKYGNQLALAGLFANLLHDAVCAAPRPDAIIPMPLHPERARERGFNQAIEIAKPLAKALRLPIEHDCLIRSRNTTPQATLPLEQRRKNMRGAFACTKPVADKHIVLLDDVMTSGATLDEAARTLKQAGAREISVWVVARALPHH